jgi:hypothetical protein
MSCSAASWKILAGVMLSSGIAEHGPAEHLLGGQLGVRDRAELPVGLAAPGLSPLGRVVIARLEHTRLWPGQVREAIEHWERFVRDPAHRLYDPRY